MVGCLYVRYQVVTAYQSIDAELYSYIRDHVCKGERIEMRVPEQFTYVPNDHPAPWYQQVDGKPRRYISPEYDAYVKRRDANDVVRKARPKSQVLTGECMVCGGKFPTTSPTERTCGKAECRKSALSSKFSAVFPTCSICRRTFQGGSTDVTCSRRCAQQYDELFRIARNRYRTHRPSYVGWDWEDHALMATMRADPDINVERYACVICGGVTYADPQIGTAYACSPEHELERKLRKIAEQDGEGVTWQE